MKSNMTWTAKYKYRVLIPYNTGIAEIEKIREWFTQNEVVLGTEWDWQSIIWDGAPRFSYGSEKLKFCLYFYDKNTYMHFIMCWVNKIEFIPVES